MEKANGRESVEPKTLSPLEMAFVYTAYQARVVRANIESSLDEAYQAHIALMGTMREIYSSVISAEMAKQKASYVVGVADTPRAKLYQLHFFSDAENLTRFVRNITLKGKIYHCTDEHGQTLLLAA